MVPGEPPVFFLVLIAGIGYATYMPKPLVQLVLLTFTFALSSLPTNSCKASDSGTPVLSFHRGTVNGVTINKSGRLLVVYGDPSGQLNEADLVLFTHHRRDAVWHGMALVQKGVESVAPKAETALLSDADRFWDEQPKARYHDYGQQGTKVVTKPLHVDRPVQGGDDIEWQGVKVRAIDTPGVTRGAVSYIVEVDDVTYAFVGDLIYGDGNLLDLTSLQDEVPDAGIRGYHGYAGRIGDVIQSLRKVRDEQPDVLVPVRGPLIDSPQVAINRLIERLRAVYRNYLSISAGRWYFTKQYDILAERVLDPPDKVPWMSYASTIHDKPPTWIVPIRNSRLLLAENGHGFLVDCGSQGIVSRIKELSDEGRLKQLDGLFITHYHDDHTEHIDTLLKDFPCPVYATEILEDVLQHPHAYRLPAMTSKPVEHLRIVPDGYQLTWQEFNLRFYDFPGQTLYHDALLVDRAGREHIFFIGDSFTPSGIDDYCLQNRCLLQPGMGYFYCLDVLETLPEDCLLINEHVVQTFAFNRSQIQHMRQVLEQRLNLLADLFPWDDANYGIDERWVRIYPYEKIIKPGHTAEIQVRILNHSPVAHEFTVTLHPLEDIRLEPPRSTVRIPPRQERVLRFGVTVPSNTVPSTTVFTADIQFANWDLRRWCEGLLTIIP